MKRLAAHVVLVACGLLLVGCNESDSELGTSEDSDETTTTEANGSGGDDTGGDDETTTTEANGSGGEDVFVDPEGDYEIEVDPNWIDQHGAFAAGVEIWYLRQPAGSFASNVNLLTQVAPDVDVQEYLDLSVQNADQFIENAELVDSGITDGTHQELGFMEYRGTQGGNQLHFLAYFAVDDGTAVVATLTSNAEDFDADRAEAETYLQSLRLLPG